MPKAKAGKQGGRSTHAKRSAARETDWEKIRDEWDANELDLTIIASAHNITPQAINVRALREGWPRRPKERGVPVGSLPVRPREEASAPVTIIHHGSGDPGPLGTFERTMAVLLSHRKQLRRLLTMMEATLDLADRRLEELRGRRGVRAREIKDLADLQMKLTSAFSKVVHMERRAFGIQDQEAPSEFDKMSPEEMQSLESIIRQSLAGRR